MTAAMFVLGRAIADWPAAAQLATLVATGAAVHLGVVSLLDRGLVGEVRDLLRAAVGERGRGGGGDVEVEAASRLS
jgi:hypothetical protein